MKLTELKQLNIRELKELAAKEGVTPSGDKRSRLTRLVALEKHFEEKEILNCQPKHYEICQPNTGEYWYRRRNISGYWRRWTDSYLLLKVYLKNFDEFLDKLTYISAVAEFRRGCVPIAASPRPP